eukprot:TRINITY_DN47197_c0_g1_i1.p1 TRINITY_DN47197_c0_g1~~TRINITY_DN47197_c0_g1_i1.p1  ORF type:complete len:215 (+),score=51.05 TRINITY_DN47197_c0_g1_i1:96-647(+)
MEMAAPAVARQGQQRRDCRRWYAGRGEKPKRSQVCPAMSAFLESIGLAAHCGALARAGVCSVTELAELSDADLENLGIDKVLHRRKLRRAVAMRQQPVEVAMLPVSQGSLDEAPGSDEEPPELVEDDEDEACGTPAEGALPRSGGSSTPQPSSQLRSPRSSDGGSLGCTDDTGGVLSRSSFAD